MPLVLDASAPQTRPGGPDHTLESVTRLSYLTLRFYMEFYLIENIFFIPTCQMYTKITIKQSRIEGGNTLIYFLGGGSMSETRRRNRVEKKKTLITRFYKKKTKLIKTRLENQRTNLEID